MFNKRPRLFCCAVFTRHAQLSPPKRVNSLPLGALPCAQMAHGRGSSRSMLPFIFTFILCAALPACAAKGQSQNPETSATFAMDTLIEQQVYGENAQKAMQEVNLAMAKWEGNFSRFKPEGDIGRVNAAAGQGPVEVSEDTAVFVAEALKLSPQSNGAFAISVAPLTAAWGVTTAQPRVPTKAEILSLLPLVNDDFVVVDGSYISLLKPGMGLDLGGIAKGGACEIARQIYARHNVSGALLSIGGNIYAHGTKPGGANFRVGFNDPLRQGSSYIASFEMEDAVIAMSGGYQRFFEADGKKYIHIINPQNGFPVESDILSVGAICQNGAQADFWSTTLYIWGKEKALQYMQDGGVAVLLDKDKNLYVSQSLESTFKLHVEKGEYNLQFVPVAKA